MSKLAVVSIAIGDHYQRLSEITYPSVRRYAEKIGAQFIAIGEQKIAKAPEWETLQLLELLGIFERVLFIHADALIRKCCPNVFDIVPETHLGLFNEAPFVPDPSYAIERSQAAYNFKDIDWDGKYYNTGVMVLSRCHRRLFRKPEREIGPFDHYFNMEIQRQKPLIHSLDGKFNRMRFLDRITGKHRYEGFIIHYSGVRRDPTFGLLVKDLAAIEALPDDYASPKHVYINVQGGLGDQMQAEPVIRYAMEHVWPTADIRVSTHYPELFAHLPIPCRTHDIAIWEGYDSEPFTRVTVPGPESPQWRLVSHTMCHTVDYCSMAVLSRIIPDIDKTYHLNVDPQAKENVLRFAKRKDFSGCVLIHAGRYLNWKNRSFPPEWWQKVSDGIVDMGLTPVYVGQNIEIHGVAKLDGRGRAIDLTDMLTLPEFIAAISLVPILISNDSSPIHLAGAFDNWIILIPTCRHPDHNLPYRYGAKSYKTAALYKKLVQEEIIPAGENCTTADTMIGPWEDYLPEVETVINKIKEINNG